MKLRTDSQRRLYGRDLLKADTVYEAKADGPGRISLVELAPKDLEKANLVKVGERLLAVGARVADEDTQKVMAEFP